MANDLNRRDAVRRVAALLGGVALLGSEPALRRLVAQPRPAPGRPVGRFAPDEVALFDEIAETILPQTATPGAKAARVGAFIALMCEDVYDPDDVAALRAGVAALDAACRARTGVGFLEATPDQRLGLVAAVDWQVNGKPEQPAPAAALAWARLAPGTPPDAPAASGVAGPLLWFRRFKQAALFGYFTSEIGMTQAQRYIETPGRFDPCIPWTKGERSWAGHA